MTTYSEQMGLTPCPCRECCEDRGICNDCVDYCIWLEERRVEMIASVNENAKEIERLVNEIKSRA